MSIKFIDQLEGSFNKPLIKYTIVDDLNDIPVGMRYQGLVVRLQSDVDNNEYKLHLWNGSSWQEVSFSQDFGIIINSGIEEQVLVYDDNEGAFVNKELGILTPSFGDYTSGIFPHWTSATKASDAFQELSELLGAIAPSQDTPFNGINLSRTSGSIFSGRLSSGLDGAWYITNSPGSLISNITTSSGNIGYLSSSFHAGTSSQQDDLDISAELKVGTGNWTVVGSRNLQEGVGTSGSLTINSISTHNTIWSKALCSSAIVAGSNSGYLGIKLTGGDGSESETESLHRINSYGNPSFTVQPYMSNITPASKWLSGIEYYGSGTTVELSGEVSNLFNPVYATNHLEVNSVYFSNRMSNYSGTPAYDSVHSVVESFTLSNNQSSGSAVGTARFTAIKANGSQINSNNVNIGDKRICTYTSPSTNLIEYFYDEDYRTDLSGNVWNSQTALSDGQSQVLNGKLMSGVAGDYPGFAPLATQYYARRFIADKSATQGTIILGNSGFSSVEPQNDYNNLTIVFTKGVSGSNVYDLGSDLGDNQGGNYGVRTGGNINSGINWLLPDPPGEGFTSGDVLWLIVGIRNSSNYLTSIEVTFG
jgi:hypothetical protein